MSPNPNHRLPAPLGTRIMRRLPRHPQQRRSPHPRGLEPAGQRDLVQRLHQHRRHPLPRRPQPPQPDRDQVTRAQDIAAARQWRIDTRPYFDAIYGPEATPICTCACHRLVQS